MSLALTLKNVIFAVMLMGSLSGFGEGFEEVKAGGFEVLENGVGEWSAKGGQVEVHAGHAKSGRQSLRILGGEKREVEVDGQREQDQEQR